MNMNFQKKNKLFLNIYLQIWRIFNSFLFLNFLVLANSYRVFVLRCFGAKIGKDCIIRPNVIIYNLGYKDLRILQSKHYFQVLLLKDYI